MSKFKGLFEVDLQTQLYELLHSYHRTYSALSNTLRTVQTYSYPLLNHTNVSSLLEGLYAVIRVFSCHFSLFLIIFIAFSLDTQSCALDCSLINFFASLFKVMIVLKRLLTIYRRMLHISDHTQPLRLLYSIIYNNNVVYVVVGLSWMVYYCLVRCRRYIIMFFHRK